MEEEEEEKQCPCHIQIRSLLCTTHFPIFTSLTWRASNIFLSPNCYITHCVRDLAHRNLRQLLPLLRLQITYIAVTIALSETGSKSAELQIVSTKTHGETWR